ncbi:MAG: hypothetical protein AB7G12_09630 [Thermoanaerobaculia bacterium]
MEFRSSDFGATPGEDEQINPGRWGKLLAEFLSAELASRGFEPTGLVAEDWGWCLTLKNEKFPLRVGCGNYEEYPDGFLVFIEPSKPYVRKLFTKVDTQPTVAAVADALDEILKSRSGIHGLSWWQSDPPGR